MVKSYCVKQKRQTECIQGSERYVQAKNGRLMMKCICAECKIVKTRFMKQTSGRGVGEKINKKIGEKIPGFQQAQDIASALMGVTGGDKDLFKKYWSGDIAKGAFNKKTGLFSKNVWSHPSKDCVQKVVKKNGKWHNTYEGDC